MKKLFLVLALLIIGSLSFPHGAFATSVCNANTDKWNVGQWCVNTADTLIPSSTAGQQVIYEQVANGGANVAANSQRLMSANETGKVLTDMGGVSGPTLSGFGSKYILPRATVGLTYTFSVGSKSFITVDTLDASDTILNSISGTGFAAGESLKPSGQAGDSVTLTCTGANRWSITQMRGSWTNNGAN